MNLTEDQLNAYEQEINLQEQFLLDHGWMKIQHNGSIAWQDPNGLFHGYNNGYDHLVIRLLLENGWCRVVETRHLANKSEQWARFQSPVTKRIYTYLDALYIFEHNWDESYYPEKFSGSTKLINDLVGENFTGDLIETVFHKNDREEYILSWKRDYDK